MRVTVWSRGTQHERIVECDREEARNVEARMRLELGAARRLTSSIAPLFSDFCEEAYVPHAQQHLGADTWSKVRCYQVATLVKFFGRYRLTEFSTMLVDEFKRQRLATGVKPSTVNNELRVLRTMLRFARDEKLPVADLKIRKLATGKRRVHCWTSEDLARLYRAARTTTRTVEAILVFLLNTGCRKGEAIAAQWSWIDWRARLVRIPVTDEWHPKDREAREVPIGDSLERLLRSCPRTAEWIFPNAHRRRFKCFPNKLFAQMVRAAKLKGGPHTCRHTYASHFLQRVPDLNLLAEVLGQSSTRVTELYVHLLPGHLERARNAVNLGPPKLAKAKDSGRTLAKMVASARNHNSRH